MATLIYCIDRDFGKLSDHFDAKEMACKDGSNEMLVSTNLIAILEKIRENFNAPVIVNSGYRTPEWNAKVDGAKDSYHMKGMAADIRIKGVSTNRIAKYADEIMENYGGVIRYSNFVHIDVRDEKYRKGV
nr:MAG TPA: peptidase [Microviridae sp.]